MSEPILKPGETYRSKRGELRTVVSVERLPGSTTASKPRPRVIWRGPDQVETTCRLANFLKWKKHGDAVLVTIESEVA